VVQGKKSAAFFAHRAARKKAKRIRGCAGIIALCPYVTGSLEVWICPVTTLFDSPAGSNRKQLAAYWAGSAPVEKVSLAYIWWCTRSEHAQQKRRTGRMETLPTTFTAHRILPSWDQEQSYSIKETF